MTRASEVDIPVLNTSLMPDKENENIIETETNNAKGGEDDSRPEKKKKKKKKKEKFCYGCKSTKIWAFKSDPIKTLWCSRACLNKNKHLLETLHESSEKPVPVCDALGKLQDVEECATVEDVNDSTGATIEDCATNDNRGEEKMQPGQEMDKLTKEDVQLMPFSCIGEFVKLKPIFGQSQSAEPAESFPYREPLLQNETQPAEKNTLRERAVRRDINSVPVRRIVKNLHGRMTNMLNAMIEDFDECMIEDTGNDLKLPRDSMHALEEKSLKIACKRPLSNQKALADDNAQV